jgi:hypothetical protein
MIKLKETNNIKLITITKTPIACAFSLAFFSRGTLESRRKENLFAAEGIISKSLVQK